LEFFDTGFAAGALDRDDVEQVLDLSWQRAEAVDQLGGKGVDLAAVGEARDAAVEAQAHSEGGGGILPGPDSGPGGDLGAPFLASRFLTAVGARRDHRFFEKVLVELDTDFANVSRLFVAEQVPGAADVEVVARELKAGPEIVEGLHHLEPALR